MVDYEVRGRVALITIRRPEARNAVNAAVANGIEEAVDRLESDDEVWVGVLTGEGTVFSAGADLKAMASGDAGSLATARGGFAGLVQRDRMKPLIAAVDGPALAGGCEIALSCDLIVASTNGSFGIPEVKRSLVAGAGGLVRLPKALPRNVAMEMALTGNPITAERAHALGLVSVLTGAGEAVSGALALAETICGNAPLAVRESRAIVAAAGVEDEATLWRLGSEAMVRLFKTKDFQEEGPRAFVEKRTPNWSGS